MKLTPEELASEWRCSRSYIYDKLKRKRDPLPGLKLGGWVIDKREAEMWAQRQQRAAS